MRSMVKANDPWRFCADLIRIMLFKVARTPAGWSGEWQRPAQFESDGTNFSSVSGPAVTRTAKSARAVAGGVELTFDDPAPGAIPDVFVIRARSESTADVSYIAFGEEPATLVRTTSTRGFGDWDKSRTYTRTIDRPTNA